MPVDGLDNRSWHLRFCVEEGNQITNAKKVPEILKVLKLRSSAFFDRELGYAEILAKS